MIRVLLVEWDKHEDVERASRYAFFDTDQKFKFLCHLAFHLTYQIEKTRFTTTDLERTYAAIHGHFDLLRHEEMRVVEELESHNGILVRSGFDSYEFAHSSMREYLCAEYLRARPLTTELVALVSRDLKPAAVAAGLSPNPSHWLAELILGHPNWTSSHTSSLFARLADVAPKFTSAEILGHAALRVLFRATAYNEVLDAYTLQFIALPAVEESIARALGAYDADFDGRRYSLLRQHGRAGTLWSEQVHRINQQTLRLVP